MNQQELQQKFEIPGILTFKPAQGGLLAAHVTAPAAEATIYINGAHLTHWKPVGQAPVIYTSPKSDFTAGKPIRGGVPVIFPWFSERHDGKTGPMHGFARISDWQLSFAAMSGSNDDPVLHLLWTLEPNDLSRSLGFDHFRVGYRMTIGRSLSLELTVGNDSGNHGSATQQEMEQNGAPLVFEEAFHTYFAVADPRQITIEGLGNTDYIDKVDNFKRKHQQEAVLHLTGRTDRPYLNTTATCVLHDAAGKRNIRVAKTGSHSTVVWNPWDELCAKMPDMPPDGWLHFTCIETANVGDNTITIQPGSTHSMKVDITLEPQ